MKKFLLILTALVLAACSSTPNLVHTHEPILNIEAALNPYIDASVTQRIAWVKNKSQHPLTVHYSVFWYAKDGVTQPINDKQEALNGSLLLQPQQKQTIELTKPSAESVNYRLYLRN